MFSGPNDVYDNNNYENMLHIIENDKILHHKTFPKIFLHL